MLRLTRSAAVREGRRRCPPTRRDARRNPIKTASGPACAPLHEILKIQLRFSLFLPPPLRHPPRVPVQYKMKYVSEKITFTYYL